MRVLLGTFALAVAFAATGLPARAIDPPGTAAPQAAAASPSPSPTPPGKHRLDPNLALVRGSADVEVKAARYYDTNDNNSNSTNQEILVVKFAFTNDTGIELTPRIDHFEFVDASGQVSTGIESGYGALVGISNYAGSVKRGDAHVYTVGFLVPQGDAGQIIYDTSI